MNPRILKKNQTRKELVVTKVLNKADPAYLLELEKPSIDENFFAELNFFDEIVNITNEIHKISIDVASSIYPDIKWNEKYILESKEQKKIKQEEQYQKSTTLNLRKKYNKKKDPLDKKTQKRIYPLNYSIQEDIVINMMDQNLELQLQKDEDLQFLQNLQQLKQEKLPDLDQQNQMEGITKKASQIKQSLVIPKIKQKKGRKKGGKNKCK